MNRHGLLLLFSLAGSILASGIVAQPDTQINERYIPRQVCGAWGWLTGIDDHGGAEIIASLGLDKELALRGVDPFAKKLSPVTEERLALFREGKIPFLGRNYPFFAKNNYPTPEQIREVASHPNFLGWRGFNEWGTGLDRMLAAKFGKMSVSTPAGRGMFALAQTLFEGHKNPTTREEFEAEAKYAWEYCNKPFNHEVYVLDGSHYWAKAWPGGWFPIRAIVTENRTPGRSNQVLQAFTRGAARMWNVPFGYFCAYDWYARISPPVLSHMQAPRDAYRNQRGWLRINPNHYRRHWYYMLMSNAALIGDESDHSEYIDLGGKGQYRLSWYGELCEEVRRFSRENDLGVSWNPVAICLSWHNGFVYRGDKAFYRFDYTPGEHMTRELMHRVIFRYSEENQVNDELGASPYGELYDVLRLDTPKGPLPLELLRNYPVLFLAGEQNFSKDVVNRLTEYVNQGGTLILNAAMLKGGEFPDEFLGAQIGEPVSTTALASANGQKLKVGKYTLYPLTPAGNARILFRSGAHAAVTRTPVGKGAVVLCGPAWLLEDREEMVNSVRRRTMLPVANLLLEQIRDDLLPFRLTGNNLQEQLLYQINKKKDGWVVALFNNGGMVSSGKASHGAGMGPDIIDPNKALTVRLSMKGALRHVVDITGWERLYLTDARDGRYVDVVLKPGDVKVLEISASPIPDRKVLRPVNLALNKKVTASSSARNFGPQKAVDGNEDFMSAWWSEKACPQELTVDLGKVESVSSVRTVMAWSLDNAVFPRFQQYTVSASADGKEWRQVVDESGNVLFDTAWGHHRHFKPVQARWLKLSVSYASCRQGAQVIEFQVFAPDKKEWVTIPWKSDPARATFPSILRTCFTRQPLSKLTPVSSVQSYKTLTADKECYNGRPITIRGREFSHGLGIHAKSEVVYQLNPDEKWRIFTAYVGIDDVSAPVGTVEFLVYADGKLVARSGRLTMENQPVPMWANLEGVRELKLVVSDCDDGINGDIADWGEATLRK